LEPKAGWNTNGGTGRSSDSPDPNKEILVHVFDHVTQTLESTFGDKVIVILPWLNGYL